MTITIRLFAILRDRVGCAETTLIAMPGSSVIDAVDILAGQYPAIAPYMSKLAYAVNETYTPGDTVLHDGDELALIPPVSGG